MGWEKRPAISHILYSHHSLLWRCCRCCTPRDGAAAPAAGDLHADEVRVYVSSLRVACGGPPHRAGAPRFLGCAWVYTGCTV